MSICDNLKTAWKNIAPRFETYVAPNLVRRDPAAEGLHRIFEQIVLPLAEQVDRQQQVIESLQNRLNAPSTAASTISLHKTGADSYAPPNHDDLTAGAVW
ncbi:MAG TPA: hypothetical protein DDZ88_12165 [Verrucomicrobiales bacterium]|nr:hypothetical protein [Verrucomicrobiales bacterium]